MAASKEDIIGVVRVATSPQLKDWPLFRIYVQLDKWGKFRRSPGQKQLPHKIHRE